MSPVCLRELRASRLGCASLVISACDGQPAYGRGQGALRDGEESHSSRVYTLRISPQGRPRSSLEERRGHVVARAFEKPTTKARSRQGCWTLPRRWCVCPYMHKVCASSARRRRRQKILVPSCEALEQLRGAGIEHTSPHGPKSRGVPPPTWARHAPATAGQKKRCWLSVSRRIPAEPASSTANIFSVSV